MSASSEISTNDQLHAPLVAVLPGEIGGLPVNVVNARELHAYLQNGDAFANWIKARIKKYDFQENHDFVLILENSKIKKGRGGDRRSSDYHLSIDMAKELCMVENNPKGREARRYFIEMERRASLAEAGHRHELLELRECVTRLRWRVNALSARLKESHLDEAARLPVHEAEFEGVSLCLVQLDGAPWLVVDGLSRLLCQHQLYQPKWSFSPASPLAIVQRVGQIKGADLFRRLKLSDLMRSYQVGGQAVRVACGLNQGVQFVSLVSVLALARLAEHVPGFSAWLWAQWSQMTALPSFCAGNQPQFRLLEG